MKSPPAHKSYRNPFRSAPVLPVDGRGYVVSVISEAGKFFHEKREPTWKRAIETAQYFEFEFPSRVVVISDYTHAWTLRELVYEASSPQPRQSTRDPMR